MKIFSSILLVLWISGFSSAQGTWTKKIDLPANARFEAASFSINGKGYLVAGRQATVYYKDFWEYNPVSNSWVQKADFGGAARREPVAFSINGKGYVGTGRDASGAFKDFWEYDPLGDTWTKKADFPGGVRRDAIGFSIGGKGYIGTGQDPTNNQNKNDFWEFDPITGLWAQKAPFPGTARNAAIGFSLAGKGYIGLGRNSGGTEYSDLWEYNPTSNSWIQKAPFGPGTREEVVSFYIGNIAYVGTGYSSVGTPGNRADFWAFDPIANTWTIIDTLKGVARSEATSFEIGGKGYIATGFGAANPQKDLWEYDPSTIGISELTKSDLLLYPNPVSRQVTLQLSSPIRTEDLIIRIITPEGKECLLPICQYPWSEGGNITVETETLKDGIYIMEVTLTNKKISMKIIVSR